VSLPYVMGTQTRMHLEGGRILRPRGSMIHDPSGRHWPKCSLLIAPLGRGSRDATDKEYEGAPEHYLGRNHSPRVAELELPSKTGWTIVGHVKRIDYVRGGTRAPGGFRHSINKPRGVFKVVHLLKGGKANVVLRKKGKFYRLDLPGGCLIDDRGIVYP
jgi:hypothetical protein